METKTVSIVVPVYKVEEPILRRCIESLMDQTLHNIEILLVDDGCPMGGGEICEEYGAADERIRVLHQENKGVCAARNAGMERARGEYITFVDSDDFVDPDYCRILYEAAEENGADMVVCGIRRYDWEAGKALPATAGKARCLRRPEELREVSLNLLRTIPLKRREDKIPNLELAAAHLYRVSRLDQLRFDEELKGGEDKYFNFLALRRCRILCTAEEVLYSYVIRSASVTRRILPDAVERSLMLYRAYRELPEVSTDMDFRSAYYMRTGCMVLATARSYFWHPDNPDKNPLPAFKEFCREEIVAEALKNMKLRELRPCKMKLGLICLKHGMYSLAAKCALRWQL